MLRQRAPIPATLVPRCWLMPVAVTLFSAIPSAVTVTAKAMRRCATRSPARGGQVWLRSFASGRPKYSTRPEELPTSSRPNLLDRYRTAPPQITLSSLMSPSGRSAPVLARRWKTSRQCTSPFARRSRRARGSSMADPSIRRTPRGFLASPKSMVPWSAERASTPRVSGASLAAALSQPPDLWRAARRAVTRS